jgi:hypothetical protein
MVETLCSFRSLDLHVVSLNIKSLTCNLHLNLALQDVPHLGSDSFHVAMGRRHTNIICIRGINNKQQALSTLKSLRLTMMK